MLYVSGGRGPFLFGGSIDFLIAMGASLTIIYLQPNFLGKAYHREKLANMAAAIMILISSINLPSALQDDLDKQIRSEDTTSYWAFLESDYDTVKTSSVTNKVVFLGSSMTFDSLNGSCVQEELPVDIQNAQVFNLAYPGDKMVFRLIDLEYLIDSDVDVVAIELSTVTFDVEQRQLLDGTIEARLGSMIFLNGASLGDWVSRDSRLEEYFETMEMPTSHLELLPRFFSSNLENQLISFFQEEPEIWEPWANMSERSGTKREFDQNFSEGFAEAIEEAIDEGKWASYGEKGVNARNYQNVTLEEDNPNLISLKIIVNELTSNGKKVILFRHPMHASLEASIGEDWFGIGESVSNVINTDDPLVFYDDFGAFENLNDFWSDTRHVNSLGKDALCPFFAESIGSALSG